MNDAVFPRRFRRRLTVAFILVAGVAAAVLAVGAYVQVRDYRLSSLTSRARQVSELNLELVPPAMDPASLERLLSVYRRRGGFETVILPASSPAATSNEAFTAAALPPDLRQAVTAGRTASTVVEVEGRSHVVVGGRTGGATAELYFFFPRSEVLADLRELATVMALAWCGVTASAAVVGNLVARRTLRPVRDAADAAGALAAGLLQTRLPAGRGDEFGEWAAWFNRMAEALEEKIVALSAARERERRFTADVAHELRTPLAGMVTAASLLEEHVASLPAPARRPAELLVCDTRRLRRLVTDLLELSRLDAGDEPVHTHLVDLRSAVTKVVHGNRWDVDVEVDVDAVVAADPHRLERIVTNLIGNAVQHGAPPVCVTGGLRGHEVEVHVHDHGPGIPEAGAAHLFDRFHKVDRARAGGGTGLGLAIALEHARALGGSIDAGNDPGGGARFTLRFPKGCGDAGDSAGEATRSSPADGRAISS